MGQLEESFENNSLSKVPRALYTKHDIAVPLQFLFLGPYINAQGLFWHVVHFVHGRRHSAAYGMLNLSPNLDINLKSSKDVMLYLF